MTVGNFFDHLPGIAPFWVYIELTSHHVICNCKDIRPSATQLQFNWMINSLRNCSTTWLKSDSSLPDSSFSVLSQRLSYLLLVSVCVYVCVCVYMCVFVSFHRKSFSWLNKTINVMPEIRPAMLCWGNDSVISTFVVTS